MSLFLVKIVCLIEVISKVYTRKTAMLKSLLSSVLLKGVQSSQNIWFLFLFIFFLQFLRYSKTLRDF